MGRLALPVFGLAPSLGCVASLKTTGLPEDFALSAVQEREHLPQGGLELTKCTQRVHKVSKRLRAPEEVEEVDREGSQTKREDKETAKYRIGATSDHGR